MKFTADFYLVWEVVLVTHDLQWCWLAYRWHFNLSKLIDSALRQSDEWRSIWTRWVTLFLGKVNHTSSLWNSNVLQTQWDIKMTLLHICVFWVSSCRLKTWLKKVSSFLFNRERGCGQIWLTAVLGRKSIKTFNLNLSNHPIHYSTISPEMIKGHKVCPASLSVLYSRLV